MRIPSAFSVTGNYIFIILDAKHFDSTLNCMHTDEVKFLFLNVYSPLNIFVFDVSNIADVSNCI